MLWHQDWSICRDEVVVPGFPPVPVIPVFPVAVGDIREPGSIISFFVSTSLGKAIKFIPKVVWSSFKLFPSVSSPGMGISGTRK